MNRALHRDGPSTLSLRRAEPLKARLSVWLLGSIAAASTAFAWSLAVQTDLSASFPYPPRPPIDGQAHEDLVGQLRQEPLQAAVLRDLALTRSRRRDILELSQKVSRRDPTTQLLLIEHAADRGDIPATLKHYAVLLVIAPGMHQGIVKVLGDAAHDRDVFRGLSEYADRPWFTPVMIQMVAKAETGAKVRALLAARPAAKASLSAPDHIGTLLALMLEKPDPQHAFAVITPQQATLPEMFAFDFTAASTNPLYAPLTWKLAASTQQVLGDDHSDAALQIIAAPNARTEVAERYTNLEQGTYRLSGTVDVHDAPKLQIQWTARCKGAPSAPLITNQISRPHADGEAFEIQVAIGENCPVQHWQLAILGDDARLPAIVTIKQQQMQSIR